MKKIVYIVPHMHWDREWYFSTEESQILLVNNMEEILTRLEEDEDYPSFVLDGQTVVLEDYLKAVPEAEDRIRGLVQKGKLIIGPWYTQTDEMITGSESIVRNLLYGLKDSKRFGNPMMIGYLPDSFGQSAQIPQILNGFHIHHAIFWRGMSEYNGTVKSEFFWESPDHSRVLALLLPLGYAIGKYLPEQKDKLKKRMDANFSELDKRAVTPFLLIPNGHDQMPIQQNIFTVIKQLKEIYPERQFKLGQYGDLLDKITDDQDHFNTVHGELLDGKYMRVHKSIYSTRMDIKTLNTVLENRITNILEPLATLAYSLGFDYYHGLIELIWKEMMKNHAHDSMGGCCSDKVNREIKSRYEQVDEKVNRLIDFYKRKIVDAMPDAPHRDKLTVFNLLPYKREEPVETFTMTKCKDFSLVDSLTGKTVPYQLIGQELVDPGLIDRQIVQYGEYDPFVRSHIVFSTAVPATGFRTYKIVSGSSKVEYTPEQTEKLENEFFKVTFNPNGTINILDKILETTYPDLLLVEDSGDDGDTYDYSPPEDDWVITSGKEHAEITVKNEEYYDQAVVAFKLAVPRDRESRHLRKCDSFVDVRFHIRLQKNKRRLDIQADFNNQAKDHRLRVLFPTRISSEVSVSDNQFGSIERPVRHPQLNMWKKENWEERPDEINPMLSYVGLHDDQHGFAVLTNSTREFEIVGERYDTIALTQFRSIGVLGKADLVRRPGRPSGIGLPTPDAQLPGKLSLHYALTSHAGGTIAAKVPQQAKEYLTPLETYNKIKYDAMRLNPVPFETPAQFSLFEQLDHKTVISAIKKAENDRGIVVRVFNPSSKESTESILTFCPNVAKAVEANLNEDDLQELPHKEKLSLSHKTCQVKTYKVYLSE